LLVLLPRLAPLWSATLSWWWGLCTDDPDDL